MWDWISLNFDIIDDGLYNIFSKDGMMVCINQEQCNNLFSSIINPTYASLSSLPCAVQGWQQIFDLWKERGIIQ